MTHLPYARRLWRLPLIGLLSLAAGRLSSAQPDAGSGWDAPAPPAHTIEAFAEVGRFPIHSFRPSEYGAHPQNWVAVQDADGLLYVGNTFGVLVYDGVRWSAPIEMPNKSIVRALAIGADGRVYVGAEAEFGVLVPDAAGALTYQSLVDRLPAADRPATPIWRAVATAGGVYFQTHEHLYRVAPDGTVDGWAGDFPRTGMGAVRDTLFTADRQRGLLRVEAGTLRPVPGGEALRGLRLYFLLPHPDGGLLLGDERALYRFANGALRPFRTEVDDRLAESWLYNASVRPDGLLVLTTIRAGAFVLTADGRLVRHLTQADGLPSSTVLGALSSHDGDLWLALDGGLARLDVTGARSSFTETEGFGGSPQTLLRYGGRLFLATNLGFYVLDASARPARFRAVPGVQGQCWAFLPTETALLGSCSDGVYVVRPEGVEPLGGGPQVYALARSRQDSSLAFAGRRDGLVLLRLAGARWELVAPVAGVTETVRSVVEDAHGRLWLGTDYRGLLRIDPGPDPLRPAAIRRYTEADGLPAGEVHAFDVEGRLLIGTEEGLFRPEPLAAADPALVPEEHLTSAIGPSQKPFHPVVDARGDLWMRAGATLGVARRQADGSYTWNPAPAAGLDAAITFGAWADADGAVWVARAEDVVRFDPARARPRAPQSTLIRGVRLIGADSLLYAGAGRTAALALPYEARALRFTFAAPRLAAPTTAEYQVRLDGFDDVWSAWMPEAQKDYTNLPPGSFTFRVRARDAAGRLTSEARYRFRVRPPWYRTWWALGGYGLGLAGLVVGLGYGMARQRLRRATARQHQLEGLVAARTQEVEAQRDALHALNDELAQANEDLQRMNDQKTELLGIAAHDLRTPLSSIVAAAQILMESPSECSSQQELLTMIEGSAAGMNALIANLLDSVAMEQGRIELAKRPVSAVEVAERAVRGLAPQALQKDQAMHVQAAPGESCPVLADPARLHEVLSNLISNALKYSPPGAPVAVAVEQQGQTVRLAVRDEGPGLSAEDQAKLFQPFQRLTPRPTGGEPSSGLGLYIVRQVVELHGGRVWVESALGRGSTFVIELPAAESTGLEAALVEADSGARRRPVGRPANGRHPGGDGQ